MTENNGAGDGADDGTVATDEYGPSKWVRIKHSRTVTDPDGTAVTDYWSIESHDDIRAVSTLRHTIVQTAAAYRTVHQAKPEPTPSPANGQPDAT